LATYEHSQELIRLYAGTRLNTTVHGGILRESVGYLAPTATYTAASISRMVQVPSNARISELTMVHDAYSQGAADIGVYAAGGHAVSTLAANGLVLIAPDTGADGKGSVIDVDFFCSAIAFLAGGVTGFDGTGAASTGLIATNTSYNLLTESGTLTHAKMMMPLWEALGFTSDPGGWFDIAITVTTEIQNALTLGMRCRFVV
jgi:hypothetical protein